MTGIDTISESYKDYHCIICQKIFGKRNLYQNHLRLHGKDSANPYHCDICEKSFAVPARLTRHYRTHTGEKPFQCEYCNKSFSVKENLSVHRRIHTKERPYKCNVCESAFEHSGKLHRHMRIHTGERPHKCSLCNKTFIQSGQLVIHMRTHTGEKPYICNSCGKGFTCSKQLKVHTRTHTGEKPYKCEICSKTFGYNHVLKLHQVAHYGEKLYKCTICQATFNSKKLMELHIRNHPDYSICNSPKSTQLFLDAKQNINKMILYNKNNYTNDNKIIIIATVKEKKIAKISETVKAKERNLYNSNNIINCNVSKEKLNQTENIMVSNLMDDKSYLSISTNLCNQRSTPQYCFTDPETNNSYTHEMQNKEIFTKNHSTPTCLSGKNVELEESDTKLVDKSRQQNGKKLKSDKYVTTCHTSESPYLYTNSLNCLIPNIKNNVSLPPRKRCKMILESMRAEKFELLTTRSCNSVIKFAKAL